MNKTKVLVIDDEPQILRALGLMQGAAEFAAARGETS